MAARGKCSDDIPKLVIDQNAETVQEIMQACGRSCAWVNDLCRQKADSGAWERVFKRVGKRLVPAYRRVYGRIAQ